MMLQWYIEFPTYMRQGRWTDGPHLTCKPHRTTKLDIRDLKTMQITTSAKHTSIEACVVGYSEIYLVKERPDLLPMLAEGSFAFNIFPSNAVNISEHEPSRWRPNEKGFFLYDDSVLDQRQSDSTSAVSSVVGRFEIDCQEFCAHAGKMEASIGGSAMVHPDLICTTAPNDANLCEKINLWQSPLLHVMRRAPPTAITEMREQR